MPKVKYDVSNVEDTGDFKQAPKGVYIAKIAEVTTGESSAGHPMLTIVLEIVKDSKGKKVKEQYGRIWHRVPLSDAQPGWTFRLKEFIKALGLKEKGAFDPEKLVGDLVQVSVKAGKDLDDNYRAEVGKLMAMPSDDDEDDDEDEDDPDDAEDEDDDDDDESDDDEDDDDEEDDDDDDDDEEDEDEEDDDDDEESQYSEMSKKELTAEARSRGLKVKKGMEPDDIIALLEENDAEDEDDDDDEDEEDYSDWSPEDLKAELKERGLKVSGSKKVLIARLEKDDESEEDPF